MGYLYLDPARVTKSIVLCGFYTISLTKDLITKANKKFFIIFNWFKRFIVKIARLYNKIRLVKGLIKSAILIFNQKGLTNPSSKFNSERAYQIRRRWYLPVRGWKIRRKKTSLKNGYKGRGQTQNTSPKWGRFFCQKGLTNPSSKFNSERAYQIRRRWYLPVRGWQICQFTFKTL